LPCDWLFSMAVEPVIIVEASNGRIVQANPAAAILLGISRDTLIGRPVAEVFDPSSKEAVHRAMDAAGSTEGTEQVICRPAGDAAELSATVSLFRVQNDRYLLVRLASVSDDGAGKDQGASPVFDAVDGASVGFLLTDAGFRIEYANQAFVDMVELFPPAEVRGKSLMRWLGLSAADLAGLRDQMLQRQATSVMTSRLLTERNAPFEVEVCAVAVPDGAALCWGFTIRELPRLN
jgi:PAS domain S-box-containing protein